MKDELTGKEITEPCKILFVDYKNWNTGIFRKGVTLEEINQRCNSDFEAMPPIVLINKPTDERS